jgi:hypothetical protein
MIISGFPLGISKWGSLAVLGTPIITKMGVLLSFWGVPLKNMIKIKAMEIYAIDFSWLYNLNLFNINPIKTLINI